MIGFFKQHGGLLRRVFFWGRIVAILVVVLLAARLLHWNQNMDPRFFRFLGTETGMTLARVMNWPNLHDQIEVDKSLEDHTEDERLWRQRITKRVQKSWPTHLLVLTNGEEKQVQLESYSSERLQVVERFGSRGRMVSTVERAEIEDLRLFTEPMPKVTWRDVRFQMEFPTYELTYSGHYTVLTDAPYYQIANSVQALENVRDQFFDIFQPLIRFPKQEEALQLLYFTLEDDYRAHQEAHAPELAQSLGYYSPLEDRMVMFNHEFSKQTEDVRAHVQEEVDFLIEHSTTKREKSRIQRMHEKVQDQIRERAIRETLSTLRHEGAHHLAYTHGLHSWIHAENAWLIEGLATYFESTTPGYPIPAYQGVLRHLEMNDRMPALADLVAVRLPADFEQDLPGIKAHEAYALSWSLFRLCMAPHHREAFFGYLKTIQDPEDLGKLMRTPRIEVLASSLGRTPEELEREWRLSWSVQ